MSKKGLIGLIAGILIATVSSFSIGSSQNANAAAIVFLIIGILLVFFSIPEIAKGSNPIIAGTKVLRPTASARATWMWMLEIFLITPFWFPSEALAKLDGPPFMIFFFATGKVFNPGFEWIMPIWIIFWVIWIFGFFYKKWPKTLTVIFNTVILALAMLWINFSVQLMTWAFMNDLGGTLMEFMVFSSTTGIMANLGILIIAVVYGILSLIIAIRILNTLTEAYSYVKIDNSSQRTLFIIAIIVSYLVTAIPLFLSYNIINTSAPMLFPFANMIGMVFVVIYIFKLISSMIKSANRLKRNRTAGHGSAFGVKSALFFVIFLMVWSPLLLGFIDGGLNSKNHSIYNIGWNGCSEFRVMLEDEGFEVRPIHSSFSIMERIDPSKMVILVILGPNVAYNPLSEIPFFLSQFQRNFSILLADDHGTTQTLLTELFISSMFQTPLTLLPKGILHENETGKYWKRPEFPIIKDLAAHETTEGVSAVCMSYGSAMVGGPLIEMLGWNTIGQTSAQYSYVDTNNNQIFDDGDRYHLPTVLTMPVKETFPSVGEQLDKGIQMGGYPQPVFAAKDLALNTPNNNGEPRSGRFFFSTDASVFNNELMTVKEQGSNEPLFDNKKFALNIINWLRAGFSPQDCVVVFDEAHIRTETGVGEIKSAAIFGQFQKYINWLSTNPVLGLIYPLLALYSLRRWIPSEEDKKKVQLEALLEAERKRSIIQFRTSSFFAKKINWYKINKRYNQALSILFRRVEKKLRTLYLKEGQPATTEVIMEAITKAKGQYISKQQHKQLVDFFNTMQEIKDGNLNIEFEEDFIELYLSMEWINDNI